MEGIILLGLLGTGYFLNDKNKSSSSISPPVMQDSSNSIYESSHLKDSKNYEKQLVEDYFKLSQNKNSKVIDNNNLKGRSILKENIQPKIKSMSGEMLSEDEFLKNDQGITTEPFFKKTPRNINFDENRSLLHHQGGPGAFKPPKKEIGQFFELEKNLGNVFGTTFSGPNSEQERYIPGNFRQNELPFSQEQVSHIDEKSEINRDIGVMYANRNSTDNIRTVNNPKLSFEGKILGGKSQNDKRGEEGEVYKHLPNQDYFQTADRWLVTTGAIDAQAIYPEQVIKDTNRQYFNEGKLGPAAPVSFQSSEGRPMVKKTTNQQFDPDTVRNATLENKAHDDSHNKDSYFAYPNERDLTTGRNHVSNLKTVFEGEEMGLQDSVKPTIKETTLSDYTGNSKYAVEGTMASDQYNRADQNINKEIIAQGRYPTPESTKLANGGDRVNIEIQKIESDYFNHYIQNQDKLYEIGPRDQPEEYTKDKDTLDNNKLSNRLDPSLLDPFKANPYTKSLSSYAYT